MAKKAKMLEGKDVPMKITKVLDGNLVEDIVFFKKGENAKVFQVGFANSIDNVNGKDLQEVIAYCLDNNFLLPKIYGYIDTDEDLYGVKKENLNG